MWYNNPGRSNWYERRKVRGFTDMGSVRIPPLPQYIVMTDRQNAALWLLSYNTTLNPPADGLGRISISSVIPSTPDVQVFGPNDGPYVHVANVTQGDVLVRLLIRNGHLGYEVVNLGREITRMGNMSVLTRLSQSNIFREIVVPTSWTKPGDHLGWKDVSF